MTNAWREALAVGAVRLGVTLDSAHVGALTTLCDRLLAWNEKIDLSAIKDPDAVREKHVLDSLAAVPMLRPEDRRIADLGSGGGFPALVLAIVEPGRQFVSVESRTKKAVFQRQVARELKLQNLQVLDQRIEDLTIERPDLATARALADIAELVRLTQRWLTSGTHLLAYKSSRVDEELTAAKTRMDDLGVRVLERKELTLPESGEPRVLVRLGT